MALISLRLLSEVQGTATPDKVLSGATFSSQAGIGLSGSMTNNATLRIFESTYSPGAYAWGGGYYPYIQLIKAGAASLAPLPTAMDAMGSAVYQGLAYSIDGEVTSSGQGTPQNTVYAFSLVSDAWSQLSNDVYVRAYLGADSDPSNGLIYAALAQEKGSGVPGGATSSYSPASGSWTALATALPGSTFLSGETFAFACAYEYGELLASGDIPSTVIGGAIAYSIGSNAWSSIAACSKGNEMANSGAWSNNAYLFVDADGWSGSAPSLSTVALYSIQTNAWSSAANDVISRYFLQCVYDIDDGVVWALDGYNYQSTSSGVVNLTTVSTYSTVSNAWTSVGNDAIARGKMGAAYLAGLYTSVVWAGLPSGSLASISSTTSITL